MRCKLRQFNKGEVQPFYHFLRVSVVNDAVIVDEAIGHIFLEYFIHEVQGIHGLQYTIIFIFLELRYIKLGSIEEYSLLEGVAPFHLHLHAELSAIDVLAEHVHDGVLVLV